MITIFQIETSTRNCSVAISQNGKTILCKEIAESGYSHAEKLHVFIEDILKETNLKPFNLDAIAVSAGPGSYTGLRIGISAAKGLCYALQIPLIGLDTLAILAKNISINSGFIAPMIDARRMECYTALFDKNYTKISKTKAEIITEKYLEEIAEPIYLIGDGAPKCETILADTKFIFDTTILFPSADKMSEIAFENFTNSEFENVAYFEPNYLKDFQMGV